MENKRERDFRRVFYFESKDADVYIFEPDTDEDPQEYIDREVSPVLGQIARSIQADYEKLCEDGFKGTFDEFYEQRKIERGVYSTQEELKDKELIDITYKVLNDEIGIFGPKNEVYSDYFK